MTGVYTNYGYIVLQNYEPIQEKLDLVEQNKDTINTCFKNKEIIVNKLMKISLAESNSLLLKIDDMRSSLEKLKAKQIHIPVELILSDFFISCNTLKLKYLLKNYESFEKIAYDLKIPFESFIKEISSFLIEELVYLKDNSNQYIYFLKKYDILHLSLNQLKYFLKSNKEKLMIIDTLMGEFSCINEKKIIKAEKLVNLDVSTLFYMLVKINEIKLDLKNDNSLGNKISQMNYHEMVKNYPISEKNLKVWWNRAQYYKNRNLENMTKYISRKVAFHLCCSSFQDKNNAIFNLLKEYNKHNSKLEGIQPIHLQSEIIHFVREIITNNKENYSAEEILKIKFINTALKKSYNLNNLNEYLIQYQLLFPNNLSGEYFLEQFKHFQTDSAKSLLVAGGWKGHSVQYLIEKENDGKFSFSIWNTGDQLDKYHPKIKKNEKELYQTCLRWSGLTSSQIADSDFASQIFTLDNKNYSEKENIYHLVTTHFGKTPDPASTNLQDYSPPQIHATCAWKSLWAVISYLLEDPVLIQKFKIDLTEQVSNNFKLFSQMGFTNNASSDFDMELENTVDEALEYFIDKAMVRRKEKKEIYLKNRLPSKLDLKEVNFSY